MKFLAMSIVLISTFSISNAAESTRPDAIAVNTACTQDASTAGCGNEKVGTGLMKCIHAYKKTNKDFKISDGCRAAMKKLHEDKKAEKAEK